MEGYVWLLTGGRPSLRLLTFWQNMVASEPYQNEQTEFPWPGVIGCFRRARTIGHFMGYYNGGTPEEHDDNPCLRRTSARKR